MEDILLNLLKKPKNIHTLRDALDYTSLKAVKQDIKYLITEGYDIKHTKDIYFLNKTPKKDNKTTIETDYFGIISDTHLGSKEDKLEALNEYYDEIVSRGIKHVFHSGDLADGLNVYPGQLNDSKVATVDEQVEYVLDNYPQRKGVKTSFITGNHEAKLQTREGLDMGTLFKRDDLNYLGTYYARINIGDKCTLDLLHPSGGSPINVGTKAQVYIREMPPELRPNIIAFGHRHRTLFLPYQGTYLIEAGCFVGTTDFLKRMGATSQVRGWINEIDKENGKILKYRPELLTYM